MTRRGYPYHDERQRALHAFRNHEVTIEQDDGVYRCVLFKTPGTGMYHFRLTTWPGHLAISGDLADYIFCRTHDMFSFFATADDWAAMPITVNPHYWGQKAQAYSRYDGVAEFDKDSFRECVVQQFREIDRDRFIPKERLRAWQKLRRDVLEEDFTEARAAYEAAMQFYIRESSYGSGRWEPFFGIYEDGPFERPSFQFLLSCYAIVWGIKRYAQVKQGRDQAARSAQILGRAAA